MVTHELRNPLSIIASTAALFDEELAELSSEQQRQYLHTISRNATRLTVMTDDLLDLARLESGHLRLQTEPTDLCQIISDALGTLRPGMHDKGLTVIVDLPERAMLDADPNRLLQVADNLLSNAVKYTPAGGTVTVTVTVDDTGAITWSVTDTGIGIPKAEHAKLFQRFYRASTALDRRIPGTGLGLVITRTIIERHHGSITLATHDGPGTTFVIRLPATPPAAETSS